MPQENTPSEPLILGQDATLQLFEKLLPEWESNRQAIITEEDARFQIINRILTEILGWPHSDISTEERAGKGYVDYLVRLSGRNKVVIEAKRESVSLLDSATGKQGIYKLSGPVLQSAKDGVTQAREYSLAKGAPYAVLTSGYQWIFFWAYRSDGIEPNDGKAIIFPSLSAIKENFALFYDLLSKEGVSDNLHMVQLNKAENITHKIAEQLYTPVRDDRVSLLSSSEIARNLHPIFRNFFGIMSGEHDREMLAQCFVESKESKEADISLRKIAQNLEANIATLNSESADELKKELVNAMSAHTGEFVLIIGQKGAGKTTFIDRFFSIILDSSIRRNCLVIRVDIGKYDTDTRTLNQKLQREFISLIEKELFEDGNPTFDQLHGIFNDEYSKRKKGALRPLYESDKTAFDIEFGRYVENLKEQSPSEYIVRLLQHAVRSCRMMPCVIFDNTDQFSQKFQECVFQFAQSIFSRIDCAFFVCPITDRSIWQLSKSGPFQSYPTKRFYLPVPKAGEILQKRVKFLKEKVREQKRQPTSYFLKKGMQLKIDNLEKFAAYIEEIFVNEEFVTGKIGRLSNFEIRRMLQLSESVITSPALSTDDLFNAYVLGTKHVIRSDKIDRALILENHNFYAPKNNDYIFNLFRVEQNDITSPLLFLRILRLMEMMDVKANGDLSVAYLSLYEVQKFFEAMGVTGSTIRNCINQLYSRRLVESFDSSVDVIGEEDRIRITPSGREHIDLAMRNKMYVSNMALRTQVRSLNLADELNNYSNARGGEKYAKIRSAFIEYCCNEDKSFIHVPAAPEYAAQSTLVDDIMSQWKVQTAPAVRKEAQYA